MPPCRPPVATPPGDFGRWHRERAAADPVRRPRPGVAAGGVQGVLRAAVVGRAARLGVRPGGVGALPRLPEEGLPMNGRYVGYVEERDPLHEFLSRIIHELMEARQARPAFRAFRLSGSNEVYAYEEKSSGAKVICKFYGAR